MKPWTDLQCWLWHFYRKGPRFQKILRQLEESGQYDALQLAEYQNRELRRVIHHCVENVPYYTDLFRSLNLSAEDIQTAADLEKLPYLTKTLVNANFDKLVSKKHRNFLCKTAKTSGTTGSPARFVRDYHSINFENAAAWRQWRQAGDHGKKRVTLRGEVVVPMAQNEPPFWRYNPANRELLMCGFHLSKANSPHYIQQIEAFGPSILSSYPSRAFMLAKFFRHHKVDYTFDAIFTSSENLDADVRRFVEDTFQCRVYDWYGQAERVAAVADCTHGRYHIQEDYSIVELLDTPHGKELVGTSLFNEVMPLLRYRTQDYVHVDTTAACKCGSIFRPVSRILGRSPEFILTPEGYRISCANHIFHGVTGILEAQFVQEKINEVRIRIVSSGALTETEHQQIILNTLENTSPQMSIVIEEVDDIPRGPNGKFIPVINKLVSNRSTAEALNTPAEEATPIGERFLTSMQVAAP